MKPTKKKLTRAQRRIIVLKDALKQLKLRKMVAKEGSVVENLDMCELNPDDELQPLVKRLFKAPKGQNRPCLVCARGALLLSTIHKENNFTKLDLLTSTGSSFSDSSTEDKRLLKLFSKKQLMLMENAFETSAMSPGINYNTWGSLSYSDAEKSHTFGCKYGNSDERLEAILKNAIKNGGNFKP